MSEWVNEKRVHGEAKLLETCNITICTIQLWNNYKVWSVYDVSYLCTHNICKWELNIQRKRESQWSERESDVCVFVCVWEREKERMNWIY